MKRPGFMPWRDQVRLGRKIVRWLFWPSSWPIWVNIVIWICTAAVLVCIASGNLWGIVAAVVVCMAVGFVMAIQEVRQR